MIYRSFLSIAMISEYPMQNKADLKI